MSASHAREKTDSDSSLGRVESEAKSGRSLVPLVATAFQSGNILALLAMFSGIGGLRNLRRGERARGSSQLFLSAVLTWILLDRRQSTRPAREERPSSVEEAPDIESESASAETAEAEHTEEETVQSEPPAEAPESVSYEALGEVAFNEHTNQVPVPQRIFNTKLLSLDAEVIWGVREADEAILVSQLYDPIQERDGLRYIGSSQIDEDRVLSIPDVALTHWDQVGGGGTAVASGTELTFLTSDGLQTDSQVLVVPEQWVDEYLGESE